MDTAGPYPISTLDPGKRLINSPKGFLDRAIPNVASTDMEGLQGIQAAAVFIIITVGEPSHQKMTSV